MHPMVKILNNLTLMIHLDQDYLKFEHTNVDVDDEPMFSSSHSPLRNRLELQLQNLYGPLNEQACHIYMEDKHFLEM